MAKYSIRQKMFTFADGFGIKDEQGRDAYFVHGKMFSFGADLSLQNAEKRELARIRQKMFTFAPTYTITRDGAPAGTMKKVLFTFRPRFVIECAQGEPLEVVGSFAMYDYSFTRKGAPVARVSKKILAVTDSYGVDIQPDEDEVFILSCAIVVDMILHPTKRKK